MIAETYFKNEKLFDDDYFYLIYYKTKTACEILMGAMANQWCQARWGFWGQEFQISTTETQFEFRDFR